MLIPNWRGVLRRAWSVRLIVVAALFAGIEVALPFVPQFYPIPAGVFAALTVVSAIAALASRIIAQKSSKVEE